MRAPAACGVRTALPSPSTLPPTRPRPSNPAQDVPCKKHNSKAVPYACAMLDLVCNPALRRQPFDALDTEGARWEGGGP